MTPESHSYLLYQWKYDLSKFHVAILFAILAAILDLPDSCEDIPILLFINGFLDLQNIHFDTRITFLSVVLKEMWSFDISGGHIGGHIGFSWFLIRCSDIGVHIWILWPSKHTFWHQNHFPIYHIKGDMALWIFRRPYWRPSWISKIATGWQWATIAKNHPETSL